ncbi:MAG: Mur ligase domain-containing protein, partial [Planctomycetes bacterium]|nr:Mur ligase domain-containing protein [Planctomycetota bacterium]
MRLSDFVPLLPHGEVQGPEPTFGSSAEVELTHAIQDSRRATPGSMFCALPGERSNGYDYVAEAVANGASAVLCGHKISACPVPQIIVEPQQLRFVAGVAASILAGRPSQAFYVCAVTGTNGKTTVAHLYQQACDALGVPCGRAGTLGLDFEGTNLSVANTSVSADCLHSWLQGIGSEGARTAVLEASSHGIHQQRLAGVRLKSMVWTNLSQDHLDYHHSMDAYAEAKAGLLAL